VKVLEAYVKGRKASRYGEFVSIHRQSFVYTVGEYATSGKFNNDIRIECTDGIHCFITRKEAEEY
jgi:hypothetical protein